MPTPSEIWERVQAALRFAPNAPHDYLPELMERVVEPLIASPRRHYRGYTNSDYATITLQANVGKNATPREVATNRRDHALANGSASPCASNFYRRLEGKSEEELRDLGTAIAMEMLATHCRAIGDYCVKLSMDEFDESNATAGPHQGREARTEVGRRTKERKRLRRYREAANGHLGHDAFRDHDMYGLEYICIVAETSDGKRFFLRVYVVPDREKHAGNPPHKFAADFSKVATILANRGFQIESKILDRRWRDPASITATSASPGHFVIRGAMEGKNSLLLNGRNDRKRLRAKKRGDQEWNRKELPYRLWLEAQPTRRANTLVAAIHGKPFKNSHLECTTVVAYLPKKGHQFRPGEKLQLNVNVTPLILFTDLDPTRDNAEWALEQYLHRFGMVENDIKEHKSYQYYGGAGSIRLRTLYAQAAMILEDFATLVNAAAQRRGVKRFVRYTFNDLARATILLDAYRNGWLPRLAS